MPRARVVVLYAPVEPKGGSSDLSLQLDHHSPSPPEYGVLTTRLWASKVVIITIITASLPLPSDTSQAGGRNAERTRNELRKRGKLKQHKSDVESCAAGCRERPAPVRVRNLPGGGLGRPRHLSYPAPSFLLNS